MHCSASKFKDENYTLKHYFGINNRGLDRVKQVWNFWGDLLVSILQLTVCDKKNLAQAQFHK